MFKPSKSLPVSEFLAEYRAYLKELSETSGSIPRDSLPPLQVNEALCEIENIPFDEELATEHQLTSAELEAEFRAHFVDNIGVSHWSPHYPTLTKQIDFIIDLIINKYKRAVKASLYN